MNRLTTSLRQFVGRIKSIMKKTEYYMVIAMMAIPLGIILMITVDNFKNEGIFLTVFGMLAWLGGIYFLNKENKQYQREKAAFYTLLAQIHEELSKISGRSKK
jgi:hypothetical protein